ncbi:hypothetical protein V2J09_005136 [Rumex salicifolius]
MMLRSSSTPILGSLLSSHSESPNNHHHSEINPLKQCYSPSSYHQRQFHNKKFGSFHLTNSCQSPLSPSIADLPASNGLRRAQSDGNLEGLLAPSVSFEGFDEFNNPVHLPPLPKKFTPKHNYTLLESIPSFSGHNSMYLSEGDEECSDDEEVEEDGEKAKAMLKNVDLGLEKRYDYGNRVADFPSQEASQRVLSKMHMAMGLGVDDFTGFIGENYGAGGGGNQGKRRGSNNGDGDSGAMEEYYKKMMEENPGEPIFMRNYADYLYQTKNDLRGAEEYYSRAILADPKDGEVLSQYAKVIWSLHNDQDRAGSYFERSVQAAPEDSVVLAAHAHFLWETEEDDDYIEGGAMDGNLNKVAPLMFQDAMTAGKA